jgi:hypothetical protein
VSQHITRSTADTVWMICGAVDGWRLGGRSGRRVHCLRRSAGGMGGDELDRRTRHRARKHPLHRTYALTTTHAQMKRGTSSSKTE